MFHHFNQSIAHITLPYKFTYPFHYTPHPLCLIAANELQEYIKTQAQWSEELKRGKMFGILIVQAPNGDIGYLAAFSGNLAQSNQHSYFVPSVYDLLNPTGFFRKEEEQISAINSKISSLQSDKYYLTTRQRLSDVTSSANQALIAAKESLKAAKSIRDCCRQNNPDKETNARLIRESQHAKANFKRLELDWKNKIEQVQKEVDAFNLLIDNKKKERKTRSAALQNKLFNQFQMLNILGESKGLCEIFEQTSQKTPPAGAGECAGPKLLQHAFIHQLKPIAMAEFWWGDSPKTEIRHHGQYYPACKGKCEPILQHMLQGLVMDENPLIKHKSESTPLKICFEDTWILVINKPEGLLSVPGKLDTDSVYTRIKASYPEATGPMIVHRLDMATSGLLLIAKTKEVHKNLQAQFKNKTIKKRYIALLDGIVKENAGTINLPLCLNPLDRPRQIVSEEYGKPALTHYEVLKRIGKQTLIAFYPITGRTHQLRVHAAHHLGLQTPIVGDELYGKKDKRLYLHAESIEFTHPITGDIMRIREPFVLIY